METDFSSKWANSAIDRIYNGKSLREAITTTAGYVTDIIDELWRLNCYDCAETDYLEYVEAKIQELEGDEFLEHALFWMVARDFLQIYEQLPEMAEWEVEFEASKRLVPLLDSFDNHQDGVWRLLGNLIAYLQGWVEGEVCCLIEAREQELICQLDWPSEFPEDLPPDGMEEFANVGVE